MLTILLINAHAIALISSHTYLPTTDRYGYANIEQWYGGTLIYAHNYLSGSEFVEADIVTAVYADGHTQDFAVSRTAVISNADWTAGLLKYSNPETLTLATCYDAVSVFIAELTEITED